MVTTGVQGDAGEKQQLKDDERVYICMFIIYLNL
jgi:hypothetical protein